MTRHQRLATLTCLSLSLSISATAQEPGSEEALVAWAEETAIPLSLDAPVPADVLRPLLSDARIVFLGEPDHYIHEKYAFRVRFLQGLHELGWRHLGMEMGRSDGIRFDEYLGGADERRLLDIGLYSSMGDISRAISSGGFFAMEFVYARHVRELAPVDERYHYFGFDLDMSPGNGLEDAYRRAMAHGAEDLTAVLHEIWKGEDPVLGLEDVIEELKDDESPFHEGLTPEIRSQVLLDLTTLVASRHFRKTDVFGEDEPANLAGAFARREEQMFELFDAYIGSLGKEERIALTGHNMHLGRGWRDTTWKELETDIPIQLWPTIGAHITKNHGDEVFAIWLVYDHGVHAAAETQAQREVGSVPETFEHLLARLPHESFLLPLRSDDPRSSWLDEKRTFRVNGGVAHGRLRELTDAVFFVREVRAPGKEL